MPQFRKKPVVIEAVQYTGENYEAIREFVGDDYRVSFGRIYIRTFEGDMQVSINDWVIRGVNGEHYPCKPDIFAKTYDAV